MITIKPARDLVRGDIFSTDGYVVESALALYDGRMSVTAHLDASGGVHKHAVLDGDFPCPIWTPDVKCQWFLHCENDATTTTPHPVLGSVPTCERCNAFATS